MFKTQRYPNIELFSLFLPSSGSNKRNPFSSSLYPMFVCIHFHPDLFSHPLQYIRRATVFYDRPVGEQVLVTICRTWRPPTFCIRAQLSFSFSVFRCIPGRGRTIKFVCPLKHNACCARSSARPKKKLHIPHCSVAWRRNKDGSLFYEQHRPCSTHATQTLVI